MSGQGERGPKGEKGETGKSYTSFLLRHLLIGFCTLLFGICLSFWLIQYRFDQSISKVKSEARVSCEAGNLRSQLAKDDAIDSRNRTLNLDFTKVFGTPPDQVENLRRLTIEATDRKIAAIPFVDCDTGKSLP